MNADTPVVSAIKPLCSSAFAYCGNNSIVRRDDNGYLWDTVFDIVSLVFSVGDVISNPGDALSWIGLVGDIVDLVPFISGAGETAKAIGVSIRITNKVDNTCDVINVVKATDFTEDAWDVIKSLDRVDGATKSSLSAGQAIHDGYKAKGSVKKIAKEYTGIHGIRPDYFDEAAGVISELKPFNKRGLYNGVKQLLKYKKAIPGKINNMFLEMY